MTPEEKRQHNGRFWILFGCTATNLLLAYVSPALGVSEDVQGFSMMGALLCGVALLAEYFVWGDK